MSLLPCLLYKHFDQGVVLDARCVFHATGHIHGVGSESLHGFSHVVRFSPPASHSGWSTADRLAPVEGLYRCRRRRRVHANRAKYPPRRETARPACPPPASDMEIGLEKRQAEGSAKRVGLTPMELQQVQLHALQQPRRTSAAAWSMNKPTRSTPLRHLRSSRARRGPGLSRRGLRANTKPSASAPAACTGLVHPRCGSGRRF